MKYCSNCGEKNTDSANYCKSCGAIMTNVKKDRESGHKEISNNQEVRSSIFDLETRKNVFQTALLYGLILVLGLLLHFFIPLLTESYALEVTYLINSIYSFVAILLICYIRGYQTQSWVWAIISGFVGYMLGMYLGLLPLLYIFMRKPKPESPLKNLVKKEVVYQLIRKGVIVYIIGIVTTYGSLMSANEGGTFTIFYGLVLWGFYLIGKAIYYCIDPEAIDKAIEKELAKDKQNDTKKSSIANVSKNKPTLLGWGIIIFIILIFVFVLLSSS